MSVRAAAVVLAAGRSRRMDCGNKLLMRGADGVSVVGRVVRGLLASRVARVAVVLGHEARAVRDAVEVACAGAAGLSGPDDGRLRFVPCADHAEGMCASLRAGLADWQAREGGAASGGGTQAVLVSLGDMPLVGAAVVDALLDAWRPDCVVVPMHAGRRGNPVLWDREFVPAMLRLSGDGGARGLLAEAALIALDVPDDAVLRDADTVAALRGLPGGPWRTPQGTLV